MDAKAFIASFTDWAAQQPAIEGLALLGSHARGEARPDSDLDLLILTPLVAQYIHQTEWIRQFGSAPPPALEDYGAVQSLRVCFEDGLEVEFAFALPDWASLPLEECTWQVIKGGFRILFDPGCLLAEAQLWALQA